MKTLWLDFLKSFKLQKIKLNDDFVFFIWCYKQNAIGARRNHQCCEKNGNRGILIHIAKRVSEIYIEFDTCSGNGYSDQYFYTAIHHINWTQPHTHPDQSVYSEMLFQPIHSIQYTCLAVYSTLYKRYTVIDCEYLHVDCGHTWSMTRNCKKRDPKIQYCSTHTVGRF